MPDPIRGFSRAIRSVRRAPGFTLAVVATLALGLLVSVGRVTDRPAHAAGPSPAVSDQLLPLPGLGFSWAGAAVDLVGDCDEHTIRAGLVGAEFFQMFGIPPRIGRGFLPSDRDARVAVLSDSLWREQFGARHDVLGRSITLGGTAYWVIGVMPAEFAAIEPGIGVWLQRSVPRA